MSAKPDRITEAAERGQQEVAAAKTEAEELANYLPGLRRLLAQHNLAHAQHQAALPSPQPIDDANPWEGVWLRSHAVRAGRPAPDGYRWCRGCGRWAVDTVFCDGEPTACAPRLRLLRAADVT